MSTPLRGVEPRHWASLAAVAEAGSFRAAAARRGRSGSAVRQHLGQLEQLVGVELVRRGGGSGAVLTAAGATLATHARGIVGELDAMAGDLRAIAVPGRGLRVGTADRGAARILARALADLTEGDPVAVSEAGDDQAQRAAVLAGDLDAGLGEPPPADPVFGRCDIAEDPIVVVAQRDWPRRRPSEAGVEDLAAATLVCDRHWSMTGLLLARLRAVGLPAPEIAHVGLGDDPQAVALHRRHAAALMPLSAVDHRDDAVVLGLDALLPPRRLTLFWHTGRRRLDGLDRLVEALRHVAARRDPAVATAWSLAA